MSGTWPESVERVAAFLRAAGAEARLEEYPEATATAEAAADAVGCTLGQIVKSLVASCDGVLHLVLVPGDRRLDTGRVAAVTGVQRVKIATAEQVVAATGFEPGGVAPFPPGEIESVVVDRSLLRHSIVWVGGGSARHMVALAPLELVRLTRGRVEPVGQESA